MKISVDVVKPEVCNSEFIQIGTAKLHIDLQDLGNGWYSLPTKKIERLQLQDGTVKLASGSSITVNYPSELRDFTIESNLPNSRLKMNPLSDDNRGERSKFTVESGEIDFGFSYIEILGQEEVFLMKKGTTVMIQCFGSDFEYLLGNFTGYFSKDINQKKVSLKKETQYSPNKNESFYFVLDEDLPFDHVYPESFTFNLIWQL